jgi:hypothetical protein
MELGSWLSFVKTSEFRGGGGVEPPNPFGTPLVKLYPTAEFPRGKRPHFTLARMLGGV